VRYSSLIVDDDNSSPISVTLARRISTGQPQEMQKNSRQFSVVSRQRSLSLAVRHWRLANIYLGVEQ
jgi:hypothetical protein